MASITRKLEHSDSLFDPIQSFMQDSKLQQVQQDIRNSLVSNLLQQDSKSMGGTAGGDKKVGFMLLSPEDIILSNMTTPAKNMPAPRKDDDELNYMSEGEYEDLLSGVELDPRQTMEVPSEIQKDKRAKLANVIGLLLEEQRKKDLIWEKI
jgi:hypothetical protein